MITTYKKTITLSVAIDRFIRGRYVGWNLQVASVAILSQSFRLQCIALKRGSKSNLLLLYLIKAVKGLKGLSCNISVSVRSHLLSASIKAIYRHHLQNPISRCNGKQTHQRHAEWYQCYQSDADTH